MPFIIQELLLSPGCTLADIKTPFFCWDLSLTNVFSLLVIVMYSQRFPAIVLVSNDR